MALVTRVVNNTGSPLYTPEGVLLANTTITFTLVDFNDTPTGAFDATTGEHVLGDVSVVTDAFGEFSIALWPNDRGDRVTKYVCRVKHPNADRFVSVVPSGVADLSWLDFKLAGTVLTPLEITQLDAHMADVTAHGIYVYSPVELFTIGGVVDATSHKFSSIKITSSADGGVTPSDLSSDVTVLIPVGSPAFPFTAENNTTGPYTVSFQTPTQTLPAPTVGQGLHTTLYTDSLNCEFTNSSGTGDVVGPTGAVAGNFPSFDASGKILSDSGFSPSSFLGVAFDYFMLADASSDIAGYSTLSENPSVGAETSFSSAVAGAGVLIRALATEPGFPGVTTITSGVHDVHIHAAKTAGTAEAVVYAEIYKRNLAGVETLLATTDASPLLTALNSETDIHFTLVAPDTALLVTDRIVVKIRASKIGVGSDPTVVIYMEGLNASRFELRSTVDVLAARYLSKAVYDTDNDGVVDEAERMGVVCRNNTGVTINTGPAVGWVYITGAIGQSPTIALADASSEITSNSTIGVVYPASIANNTTGKVITKGRIHGVDTSAYTDGDVLWLSDTVPGAATTVRPAAPSHGVFLGWVAYAHATQGIFIVDIQNGSELAEQHDVLITTPAAGEMLRRRADNLVWENGPGRGQANGVASLGADSKILLAELPTAIAGAMNYQGTWDASTNTPTLASGVGTKGYYYRVTVAGTTNLDGNALWSVGDFAVFNGTVWEIWQGNISAPELASILTGVAAKTTPVDADEMSLLDSAAAFALKKFTFADLWAWVQAKFHGAAAKATPVDSDELNILDSAAAFVAKKMTFANLWTWVQAKQNFATGIATFLTTPSSANLAAAVTDETGSGSVVFNQSPTINTPGVVSQTISGVAGNLYSSNYTPTITNITNIASSTASASSFFTRIGDWVLFDIPLILDPSAVGEISVEVSLPVPSNFTSSGDAIGAGTALIGPVGSVTGTQNAILYANTVNDTLVLVGYAGDAIQRQWQAAGRYRVL